MFRRRHALRALSWETANLLIELYTAFVPGTAGLVVLSGVVLPAMLTPPLSKNL
jgi:hypothetical protein